MPILTLEHTSYIRETIYTKALFYPLHKLLVKLANANLKRCKSRAINHSNYFISDGNSSPAFITLTVRLLEGRSKKNCKDLGKKMRKFLLSYFLLSLKKLDLQISVNIIEMPKEYNFV